MISLIISRLKMYNLPRKMILLADMGIIVTGFPLAYLLRYNFDFDQLAFGQVFMQALAVISPVYLMAFLWSGSYRGIIRHSSIEDAVRLFTTISLAMVALFLLAVMSRFMGMSKAWSLSGSVLVIHTAISTVLLMGSRLVIRVVYHAFMDQRDHLKPVLIFGAGSMGQITLGVIENDRVSKINVVGFIDDNKTLVGKRLAGKPIYSEEEAFGKVVRIKEVKELILAVTPHKIILERKKALFDRCLKQGVRVREIPPVKDWIDGRFNSRQLREPNIEDLLGRDPIWLNQSQVADGLKGAVVLVTGAAGSIGSEIARQLMAFDVNHAVFVDQAESPLYDLQNELLKRFSSDRFSVIVASITDLYRMQSLFEKYRPQYVFNAAAYKHVPLMEDSPYEALRVNVGGTRLLADLSVKFGVKKFVMISTDKAVNPTNVMGASKRICEIYIQALTQARHKSTQFITTRFGNVLGSNGSVVPLFRRQIEEGGPVTVTHPDIIRYFMTIPEACQLVLEAGFMGHGGEIYVFDMGEPVKIYDLAVKMISLAGLKPVEDIPILFTGLRPGEKLYEELLADEENTIPTHHPKIKVAQVREHNFGVVNLMIDELLGAIRNESEADLVIRMKALVPEFISQNSKYSKYDEVTA
ncbi:polysaccharide biosynthesis protein [Gaoshiqia sp. Z1-71]|uniref:polysaccharide biosynthesis protein n=1 Tax=Gaoshiqia hydrogeniformans TaxID=3290090 RepID=UPI003BF8B839